MVPSSKIRLRRSAFSAMRRTYACAALGIVLVAASCSRATNELPGAPEKWIVVYGTVTTEAGLPVETASVRSVASGEEKCDEHGHAGVASPEVVQTGSDGHYRQMVLGSPSAYCVHILALTSDSSKRATATIGGARFRPRTEAADSTKVNLVVR